MNRKYSGFTLVEMLIVMGIIIILMVVGITAGRFAINRANDVAHKNAADQIYVSLQAFYTDERHYPAVASDAALCVGGCDIAELVGTPPDGTNPSVEGTLVPYFDKDSFKGGSTSSWFYGVGGDGGNQAVMVCVTLRGDAAENTAHPDGAIYCAGNGLGAGALVFDTGSFEIPASEMNVDTHSTTAAWLGMAAGGSTWDGDTW